MYLEYNQFDRMILSFGNDYQHKQKTKQKMSFILKANVHMWLTNDINSFLAVRIVKTKI